MRTFAPYAPIPDLASLSTSRRSSYLRMSTPTAQDVARIAAMGDLVLRNLQITQCYSELAHAAEDLFGSGANWCAFATWASKQAGRTIRGEDMARTFEDRFADSPEVQILLQAVGRELQHLGRTAEIRRIREAVVAALNPRAALRRASVAVARGNVKVFEEIGFEIARFLEFFAGSDVVDPERVESFCETLPEGEPLVGQSLLRDAFRAYGEACRTSDSAARAQLLFYGNVLIGLHEQTRLQPEIEAAMDASLGDPDDVRQAILKALLPGFWLRLRIRLSRILKRQLPLDALLDQLVGDAQQLIRQIVTQSLLTLPVSRSAIVRFGRDIGGPFPPALARLTHPELTALIQRIDPTPDNMSETAAEDWADLDDRMHFITDFFRCYHAREALFDAPFTAEQVSELKAGRRPAGQL